MKLVGKQDREEVPAEIFHNLKGNPKYAAAARWAEKKYGQPLSEEEKRRTLDRPAPAPHPPAQPSPPAQQQDLQQQQSPQQQQQQQQDQQPLSLLMDQQKKKYCALIDRMNDDNKRKQAEIDHLKAELALVQEVLALGGLQLDMKELHALAHAKQHTGAGADVLNKLRGGVKAKVSVLPPIKGSGSEGGEGADAVHKKGGESGVGTGKRIGKRGPRIPGPQPPPIEGMKRESPRARVVKYATVDDLDDDKGLGVDGDDQGLGMTQSQSAVAAEGNAQFHGEPSMSFGVDALLLHRVTDVEPGGKSQLRSRSVSWTHSVMSGESGATLRVEQGGELPEGGSRSMPVLPPIRHSKGDINEISKPVREFSEQAQVPGVATKGGKVVTKWSKRVQGTKVMREKQWKEMKERG
ncbi:hypothetical protein HK104_002126 [Borealophlyctis nickersoniae]|nr:hypothetical protein HK104_002126 [Borealophlyctis nickersoniae]